MSQNIFKRSKILKVLLLVAILTGACSYFIMDRFGLGFSLFQNKLLNTFFTKRNEINCESYDEIIFPLEDSKDPDWIYYRVTGFNSGGLFLWQKSSSLKFLEKVLYDANDTELYVFVSATFIHSAQDEHQSLVELVNRENIRLVIDYPLSGGLLDAILEQCNTNFCTNLDDYISFYFGPTMDQSNELPDNLSSKFVLKHYGFKNMNSKETYKTHNNTISLSQAQLDLNNDFYFPDNQCVTSGIMLGHFTVGGVLGINSKKVLAGIPEKCLVFTDALEMAKTSSKVVFGEHNILKLFTNWSSLQRTIKNRQKEMKCSIKKIF
ncbi:hypothetical protein OAO56_03900 [Amylibacter sp.]|nr:hypothetical protein [Amylibacter sp.]